MKGFFKELQRRKVYTVGVAYVVVAWVLLQVAATVLPIYDVPDWTLKAFTSFLFVGFPVAVILAWVYELTPAGVRRSQSLEQEQAQLAQPNRLEIALPSGPSIAVLSFKNLSGDSEQDLLAEALAGDISTGLTKSSHLFVKSAGEVVTSPGQGIADIGRQLGVHYLLEGSVRKAGDTLRISAKLHDASNGEQVWSQVYDRKLSAENLFAVQDDIREQIVATLSDFHGVIYSVQAEKNVHRPTSSLDAYECMAVALAYDKYISEEYHLKAREALERAVKLDPEYDDAWAHLSWIYTDEWVWEFNPLPDSKERALTAAMHAIKLAPKNYHNHWLLSRVHYFMGNLEQFRAEASRSLELNSSEGTTLGLIGMYTAWSGDWDRGMEMMSKAKQLNPNFPDYYHLAFGVAEYVHERYSDALHELSKAQLPEFSPMQIFLGATCAKLGKTANAEQHLAQLTQLMQACSQDSVHELLIRTFPFLPELADELTVQLGQIGLPETASPEGNT